MIHPTREDWMSYLYDEMEAAPRKELEHHLSECLECQARVNEWQQTARGLDAVAVSKRARIRSVPVPWFRLATMGAAAALVLAVGFAWGRSSGVSPAAVAGLRNQIAVLSTNYSVLQASTLQIAGATDQRFQLVQAQQASDYASLRKELETVAVLTDASFQRTENKLVQLAGADNSPNLPVQ